MRRTRVRTALAVAGMASAMLLAACGGSSSGTAASTHAGAAGSSAPSSTDNGVEKLSATEILSKAEAAAVAAKAVRISGSSGDTSIDLQIGSTASDGKIGTKGVKIEILWVGGVYYLKADAATWTSMGSAKLASRLSGKFVKIPAAMAAGYKGFTDLAEFFGGSFGATGTITKVGVTTVDGQHAVTLKDSSDGSLIYIATDGEPYPIKAENKGTEAGLITFTGWGKPGSLVAPPAAQVVDLTKL